MPEELDRNSADRHNKRYLIGGRLEAVDLIEMLLKDMPFLTGVMAFDYGNAIKYLVRLGKKDGARNEIRKAINYLEMLDEKLAADELEEATCRT